MALPLAPVLFPEIEGPEFVKADEVADVARTVLAKHGKPGGVARLFPVAQALAGNEFSIAYGNAVTPPVMALILGRAIGSLA